MSLRLGLYGGSFDPVHFGHLISARSIAELLSLERIVLIPSARPPHKKSDQLASPEHRLAMTRLAVEGDPLFEVSDVEIHRTGPSYTFDTVTGFRERYGKSAELFWIIGADTLPELPTWYRVAELVNAVQIVTAARPGWQPPMAAVLARSVGQESAEGLLTHCYQTDMIEISATGIRERVGVGKSIRYLTPEAVASYIEQNGIYKPG